MLATVLPPKDNMRLFSWTLFNGRKKFCGTDNWTESLILFIDYFVYAVYKFLIKIKIEALRFW